MLTCSTHKSYLDRQFPAPSVLQPSETWRDNVQLAQSLHMPCFLSFFMTPKHSFSLQTPGENRKVSTTSRRLALQRKSHQRQNVMKRLKRNTTRHHDLHGVPWSRGKDGFFGWLSITRGRRHVSAAFGMCINNYWKIVIVSCNKNVTLDDIRDQLGIFQGISMPYLYIVFMIPQ